MCEDILFIASFPVSSGHETFVRLNKVAGLEGGGGIVESIYVSLCVRSTAAVAV